MNGKQDYFATTDLSQPIQRHLVRVYNTLAATVGVTAATVYFNLMYHFWDGGFLSVILLVGLAVLLRSTPATPQNDRSRMGMLLGIGALQGVSMTSLVGMLVRVDPSIVLHATVAAALIFVSFSGVALTSRRRSYLYLGGILGSVMSILMWTSLFGMFFRNPAIYSMELYLGLAAFMGYVIFDTQLIVERAAGGSRDFIGHAFELFSDLVQIFIRLAVIMLRNNQNRRDGDRKKRRD